jgi:hypothetical protein
MIINEIGALNEIAKLLVIHNEIQLLQLTKQYEFSQIINIKQELQASKDKITAVSEKPIDVWKNKPSEILNYPPPENRKID